ncbi:hypothetical protein SAMN04487866_1276 [Thermoactinomyces sp. DSM 45891]|nr:hypothetical protein SAMN04487866_1276 [Thermoactinomyces sp. DSM 45891]
MRKILSLCIIGVLLMGTGCNSAIEAQQAKRTEIINASIEKPTAIDTIIRRALGIGEIYPSIESLSRESSIIIQGVVISRSTFQSDGVTFVKSTVKVTKTLSGKASKGDTLPFITPLGFNTLKKSDKVVLFGRQQSKDSLLLPDTYTTVGGFQGQFHIKGNRAKRNTEHLNKADQKTFPSLEMKLSLLIKKIKKAKQ